MPFDLYGFYESIDRERITHLARLLREQALAEVDDRVAYELGFGMAEWLEYTAAQRGTLSILGP
ncbi:MAG: hypothetical protein AAGA48_32235 [Myxococcota bacterium]